MNAKPWYQSTTIISLVVAVLTKLYLLSGQNAADANQHATNLAPELIGLIGVVCDVIAMYGRKRAQGPVTMTQASAEAVNQQQGGYVRVGFLVLIFAMFIGALSLPACTGMQSAYKEAASHKQNALPDTAFVVTSHYASIVHQARLMKEAGSLNGAALVSVQEALVATRPFIDGLNGAVSKYSAIQNAQTQADLQKAVDDAVIALADLVRKYDGSKQEIH